MDRIGYYLYLVFTVSWFTHLSSRIAWLGTVRFDLLLVIVLFVLRFASPKKKDHSKNNCYRTLVWLILFIMAVTPFAEWPGSAIRSGLPNFVKAAMFFFLSLWYLTTRDRIRTFVSVFILCQSFRILEPLYLHVTDGYWGSKASMANWESMNRLSGAPSDIVNPNGLAFIVLTTIPIMVVLCKTVPGWKIFALAVGPASLYVLYLTASRSGMIGLAVILLVFFYQSRMKLQLAVFVAAACILVAPHITGNFKDRYLSIVSNETKNAGTAEGRITGVYNDVAVALRRPLTGYGLGTSREANANFGAGDQISHNIYAETFQEIGIGGLVLFVSFMLSIVRLNVSVSHRYHYGFLWELSRSLLVLAWMNIFFGMASYGLSGYEWYFLGGLSTVVADEVEGEETHGTENTADRALACRRDQELHPIRVPEL